MTTDILIKQYMQQKEDNLNGKYCYETMIIITRQPLTVNNNSLNLGYGLFKGMSLLNNELQKLKNKYSIR